MHNSFGGSGGYPGPYPGYVPPPTALPYYNGYPGDLTQVSSPYYGKPAAVPPGYSSGMGSYSAPPINNSSMYYQQYGLGYQYGYTKYGLGSGLGSSLGSNLGYSSELAGASGITPPSLGGLQAPTTDLGLTGSMFSKGKYNGGQGSPSPLTAAGLGVGHGGSSLLSPVTSTPPSPGPHNIPSGLAGTGATPSPPVDIIESKKDLDKMRRCQVCGQVFRLMSECLAHMKSVHAVHEAPLSVYSLQHSAGSHLTQSLSSTTSSGVPSALSTSLGPPNSTRAGGVGAPDSPLMALERMGWGEKQSLLPSLHASPSPLTPAYTPAPAVTPGPQHPSTQHLSSQHMSSQHPPSQHHPQHHSSQHSAQHTSNHHPASQTPPAPHPLMETSQDHHSARTPVSSLSMTYSMRTDTQVSQAHSRHAYSSPTCSVPENIPVSDTRTEIGVSSNYSKPRKTSSYSVSSIIGETKERVIERESNVAHEIPNSLTGQSPTRRQVSPAGRSSMPDGFEQRISQLKQQSAENSHCSRTASRTAAEEYSMPERETQGQKEQVVPDQHHSQQVDVHKGLQMSHGTPDSQKEDQKSLADERRDVPEDLSRHVPSSPTTIHGTLPSLHHVPSRETSHVQEEMMYEKTEKKRHLNSRMEDTSDSTRVNSPQQKEDDRTNSSIVNQQPSPQEVAKEPLSMEKATAVLKEQVSQIGKRSWSPAQSHYVQHQLPQQQQTSYQQTNQQQQPASAAQHQVPQPKHQQAQQSQHQQSQLSQQQSQLSQHQQPQAPQHLQGQQQQQQQQGQQVHHHQGQQSQQNSQQPQQSQHQAQQTQQPSQLSQSQQQPTQISQSQQTQQLSQPQQQSQLTQPQQPPQIQAQHPPQLSQAQQAPKPQPPPSQQPQQHHHPQQQRQPQQPGYSNWSGGVGSGYSGQGTQYPYGYSQGSNSQSSAGGQHPQSPMAAHKSSSYHPMPNNYASPYGASPGSGYPPDLAGRGPPGQQGYPAAHWYAAAGAGRMDSKSGWNIWGGQGHQPAGFPQSYAPYPYPAAGQQQQQKSQLSQQQSQQQHSQPQKQSQPAQPQLPQPSQSLQAQSQQILQSQIMQSQPQPPIQTQHQPPQPQGGPSQALQTQGPQPPQPKTPRPKTPQSQPQPQTAPPHTPQQQPHTPQTQPHTPQQPPHTPQQPPHTPQQPPQTPQQQAPQMQPPQVQPPSHSQPQQTPQQPQPQPQQLPQPQQQQQTHKQQPEPQLQMQPEVPPQSMAATPEPQAAEGSQEALGSRQSEQELEEALDQENAENEEEEQLEHYPPAERANSEDPDFQKEKLAAVDNHMDYQSKSKVTTRPPTNSVPKKPVYKIGPKSKTLAAKQYSQIDDLDDYKCTITVHENGSVNGYGVLPTHPSAVKGNSQSCDSSDSEINSEDGSPTFVQLRPAKRRRKSQSREGIFIGPKRVKQARLVRERQERRHRHLQEQLRQTELEEQIQAIRAEKSSEEDGPLGNMLVKSSIILADSQMEEQDNVEQCIATIKAQQMAVNSSESGNEPDSGDKLSSSSGQVVGKKAKKSHTSKVFHNENSVIIKTLPRPVSTRKLRAKDFKWSHYIKSMRYWCSDCAHGFKNQKEVALHSEDRCKWNCLYMLECYVIVKDVQAHPQYGPKVITMLCFLF